MEILPVSAGGSMRVMLLEPQVYALSPCSARSVPSSSASSFTRKPTVSVHEFQDHQRPEEREREP